MANDELYTPKWVFDSLNIQFDLDVCAPEGGALHTPAVKYFDKQANGLTEKWFGLVWMNPPYSDATPWVNKWLDHGNGLALTQISKSKWTKKLWDDCRVKACYLSPKLKFINQQLQEQPIFMPCVLWAIGDVAIEALEKSNLGYVR